MVVRLFEGIILWQSSASSELTPTHWDSPCASALQARSSLSPSRHGTVPTTVFVDEGLHLLLCKIEACSDESRERHPELLVGDGVIILLHVLDLDVVHGTSGKVAGDAVAKRV